MSYATFFLPTLLSFRADPPISPPILCLPPASGSRISAGRPPPPPDREEPVGRGWASGRGLSRHQPRTHRAADGGACRGLGLGGGRAGSGRSGLLVRHLPPHLSPAPSLLRQVEAAGQDSPEATQKLGAFRPRIPQTHLPEALFLRRPLWK